MWISGYCREAKRDQHEVTTLTSFSVTCSVIYSLYGLFSTKYAHPLPRLTSEPEFILFFNRKFASIARVSEYKNLDNI